MLLLGSSVKVAPIVEWDGQPIADGKPGPVARALLNLLEEDMRTGDRLIDAVLGFLVEAGLETRLKIGVRDAGLPPSREHPGRACLGVSVGRCHRCHVLHHRCHVLHIARCRRSSQARLARCPDTPDPGSTTLRHGSTGHRRDSKARRDSNRAPHRDSSEDRSSNVGRSTRGRRPGSRSNRDRGMVAYG